MLLSLCGIASMPLARLPGFAGMYHSVGFIPPRQFGVAGEDGPEMVFVAEVLLIVSSKQSDTNLAMNSIAELALSRCKKVPDDELFTLRNSLAF